MDGTPNRSSGARHHHPHPHRHSHQARGGTGHHGANPRGSADSIAVVVRVRPLLAHEIKRRSREIAQVAPDCGSVRLQHLASTATGRSAGRSAGLVRQQQPPPPQHDHRASAKAHQDVKDFAFSFVAPPGASQAEFFEGCGAARLLDFALDGYASTIFAYGQTGSGKTYTISGSEAAETAKAAHSASAVNANAAGQEGAAAMRPTDGLIPRAIEHLFAEVERREARAPEEHAERVEYSVRVSFYEIYNELVFDLLGSHLDADGKGSGSGSGSADGDGGGRLSPGGATAAEERARAKELRDAQAFSVGGANLLAAEMAQRHSLPVRYDESRGGFVVQGLTSKPCMGKAEVLRAFARGFRNRRRGSHLLNDDSSRSHAIMTLDVEVVTTPTVGALAEHGGAVRKHGKVVFVDLAGSERVKETGVADGTQLKEATNINRSLFTLGKVISALDRNSKAEQARCAAVEAQAGLRSDPANLDAFQRGGFRSMEATVVNTFGHPHPQQQHHHPRGRGGRSPHDRDAPSPPAVRGPPAQGAATGGGGSPRRGSGVVGVQSPPPTGARDVHVPYRDSKLTMLLMDSLGGSSRTLMIACISPAEEWSDESFSTLNYATRAKNIVNKPAIRVDHKEELVVRLHAEIRALQLENTQLKAALKAAADTTGGEGREGSRGFGYGDNGDDVVSDNPFLTAMQRSGNVPGGGGSNGNGNENVGDGDGEGKTVTAATAGPPKDIMREDFGMLADFNGQLEALRLSLTAATAERDALRTANSRLEEDNARLVQSLRTAEVAFLAPTAALTTTAQQGSAGFGGGGSDGVGGGSDGVGGGGFGGGGFDGGNAGGNGDADGDPQLLHAARMEVRELRDKLEYMAHRERQLEQRVRSLQRAADAAAAAAMAAGDGRQ